MENGKTLRKEILNIVNKHIDDLYIYTDYRDYENIESLLKDCENKEIFCDKIYESYFDSENYLKDCASSDIQKVCNDKNIILKDYERDIIEEMINEAPVEYPLQEYLNQTIKVNVFVKYRHSSDVYEKEYDKTTVAYLLTKCGYKAAKHILNNIEKGKVNKDDKFLLSIYDEIFNMFSNQYNALCFVGYLTISDYFKIKDNKKAIVKIPYNTTCGFVDSFNGGGSILGIELPKDIYIQSVCISDLKIEKLDKYTVDDIYGLTSKCYKDLSVK